MKIPKLLLAFAGITAAFAQPKSLPLDSAAGLTLQNTIATPVTCKGKKAIKAAAPAANDANRLDHLGLVNALDFSNGTIEVDLAGEVGPVGGARGFVGIAFRVQPDRKTYDCFYVRPTNGRTDDQERRNHSAQ